MREILGDRVPNFTEEERQLVLGSSDFYGMNTYTTKLISAFTLLFRLDPALTTVLFSTHGSTVYLTEAGGDNEFFGNTTMTFVRPDGTQLGTQAQCSWLQSYAPGFRQLLGYLYGRYKTPI